MSERIVTGLPQAQGPGEDPLYHYTRLFVRFLQLVFGSFEKGNYHWDEDEALTDVLISDQAVSGRDVAEKRPAIIVMRGPANFAGLAMDQFHSYDPSTGARTHTDLVSCSVTYNCLSSEGVEAQRLAWISMMATRRLKRTLMRAGLHRVGEEVAMGPESPPGALIQGDPAEITLVTVSVPFFFQDAWSVEPVDKVLLKNIDLALTSKASDDVSPTLKEPGMNGRELNIERTLSLTSRVRAAGKAYPKPRK